MTRVVLGLGSNIGDRFAYMGQALAALLDTVWIDGMECTAFISSAAVLPEGAPREWDIPFLNNAVVGEVDLSPEALLMAVKTIEARLGRKARGVWGPREIDIDILVYGDLYYASEKLHIPHRHLLNRPFALNPLAKLWPDWRYPIPGPYFQETASRLCQESRNPPIT